MDLIKKWLVAILLIGTLCWMSYNYYFKILIHDYEKGIIEKELKMNFDDNRSSFDDIVSFSENIKRLDQFEFYDDDYVKFRVYDSVQDWTKRVEESFITYVGESSDYPISDVSFGNDNKLNIWTKDTIYSQERWIIEFYGQRSDPLVKKLLNYNNIRIEDLIYLEQKLRIIECTAFDKSDDLIIIGYRRNYEESYQYLIPLSENDRVNRWEKLDNDFYWIVSQVDPFGVEK